MTALDALKELERQRDALDPAAEESRALRHVTDVMMKAAALDARIVTIRNATFTLPALDAQIAAEIAWRETLVVIRMQLCVELLSFPKRIYDGVVRAQYQNVDDSIASIDSGLTCSNRYELNHLRLGQLLVEHGHEPEAPRDGQTYGQAAWYGDLTIIEQRLKRLRHERDEAQRRLDQALLTDDARAAQLADVRARNARQPQRKTRGDGSRYDKFPDGRIEELEP